MLGPWKLFHILFRVLLVGFGVWVSLALLWGFLPYPSSERDDDPGTIYATKVLLGGKSLCRVYETSIVSNEGTGRMGFALDYKLNISNLTLSISRVDQPVPIINPMPENGGRSVREVNATARGGDTDGANLPWFPTADAILLFWWLHKDMATLPLRLEWSTEDDGELQLLNIRWKGERERSRGYHLLTLRMRGNDTSTITATVPEKPASASTSYTYPIRAAIILIIAPPAIFVNEFCIVIIGLVQTIIDMLAFIISWIILLSSIVAVYLYFSGKKPQDLLSVFGKTEDRLYDGREDEAKTPQQGQPGSKETSQAQPAADAQGNRAPSIKKEDSLQAASDMERGESR